MTHKLAPYEDLLLEDIIALLKHVKREHEVVDIDDARQAVSQLSEVALAQRHFPDNMMFLAGLEPVPGSRCLEVSEERYSWMDPENLTPADGSAMLESLSAKLLAHYLAQAKPAADDTANPAAPDAPTQA